MSGQRSVGLSCAYIAAPRRGHVRCVVLLALLVLLGGCGRSRELHIALHPWIGYETLTLAEDLGWLPDEVVLHRGATVEGSLQAMVDGSVDAAATTLDEALRLRAVLPTLQVVLVMDESAGADMVVARPDVAGLGDLAGRRVAYESTAVTQLLLRAAVRSAGLSVADVESVDLPVDQHAQAYAGGRVDAAVSYFPYVQDLLDSGAVALFDSRSVPGTILDVLVVDGAALRGRESLQRRVVAAHFRALRHLRSNPDDAVYRIAGYQGRSAASVRRSLDGVRLPGVEAVRSQLDPSGGLAAVFDTLLALGAVPAVPPLATLLNPDLLPPQDDP